MAKVLVACEYSGIVRDAFTRLGHDAWSIDILPTESKGQHIQDDVLNHLNKDWDLMVAHPPCTYLCVTGTGWLYHPDDKHLDKRIRRPHPKFPNRREQQKDALEFVQKLMDAPIEKICIENPVSVISSKIRKPNQYVQPYEYGHLECKKTGLWLKNLPTLTPTKNLKKKPCRYQKDKGAKTCGILQAKTEAKLEVCFSPELLMQWQSNGVGNYKEVDKSICLKIWKRNIFQTIQTLTK